MICLLYWFCSNKSLKDEWEEPIYQSRLREQRKPTRIKQSIQTTRQPELRIKTCTPSQSLPVSICHPTRSCLRLWVTIMHNLVFTRSSRYKGQKPHYAQITSGREQALVSYTSQMNCLQSPSSKAQAFRMLITSSLIWARSLNTSALWMTSVLMEERRRKKERWMNVNQHRERECV